MYIQLKLYIISVSLISLVACSTARTRREEAPPAAPATAAVVEEKPKAVEVHHHKSNGVDPDQAQKWLINGNARFVKGSVRKDGQSKKDIARLATGQKPHSIILSCSDSRVPPEIVFDQKLGEVFVVRTAGESLAANAVGSIEYAIEHLGARNIVVMGHTSCGAVKAAIGTLNGEDAGSTSLNSLVADLHPHLQSFKGKPSSTNFEPESWANVTGVAADLLARSPLIAQSVREGDVKIREAVYNLETGKAEFH